MTNDNDESPFTTTNELPQEITFHPDFGEPGQLLNMRGWLQKAAEAQGAKMTGGGFGMGEADIDIQLEGHNFNLRIKPIIRG